MVRYLLRHPEPAGVEGLCYGRLDVRLQSGWEEVIVGVLRRIEEDAITRIVTSPARRCQEPALWLAERLAIPVVSDERLWELDFGLWEGRRWSDIDGPEARTWGDDFVSRAPPGGESFAALAARIRAAKADWHGAAGHTLFMSHGGPLRVLLADQRGLALAQAFTFAVTCGELIEISWFHEP